MKIVFASRLLTAPYLACFALCAGIARAQDAPPAPAPAPSAVTDFTAPTVRKLALARVPGTFVAMDYDDNGYPASVNILDAKGRECVVFVSEKTHAITRVVTPRMTKKAAAAVAMAKLHGTLREGRPAFYDPKAGGYIFTVNPKKKGAVPQVVTVSDKTGKVVHVEEMPEVG